MQFNVKINGNCEYIGYVSENKCKSVRYAYQSLGQSE